MTKLEEFEPLWFIQTKIDQILVVAGRSSVVVLILRDTVCAPHLGVHSGKLSNNGLRYYPVVLVATSQWGMSSR